MSEFCPFCKKPISRKGRTCQNCGSIVADEAFDKQPVNPGDVLNERYKIIKEVGKGGMGAVYKAEETTMATGRFVAVKLLPAQMTADKAIMSRFRDEIKVAAMLDHPNIVPIYFVGEHQGLYYFVMKYLEGGTIHQIIKKSDAFHETEVRRIIADVCEALDYAHKQGVVHRDIKASNIIISPEGKPTLMDFGVARSSETSDLTMPGQIVGTAEYIAPEQWYGEAEARSDIYSLGVVMYYMLAGKLPFTSKNAFELMKMHQEAPPPPVKAFAPAITREMEGICHWCLEKEKEGRPSKASTLAAALRQEMDLITDPMIPPPNYDINATSQPEPNPTMVYPVEPSGTELEGASPTEQKINQFLLEADREYESGNLRKALKLAKKAMKLAPEESTKVDYRLKKYSHLLRTIEDIQNRSEKKFSSGLIHQAVRDLETVLQVYDIPEVRQRLTQMKAFVKKIEDKYAEGKKLQLQGHFESAVKRFDEVIKYDAENVQALERKHDLRDKIVKVDRFAGLKRILKVTWIPTLIGIILIALIMNFTTMLQKFGDHCYESGNYSQPGFFNAHNFYSMLESIEGPNQDNDEKIDTMIANRLNEGNEAYDAENLRGALKAYSSAVKMMEPGTPDRDAIEVLVHGINKKLEYK